MKFYSIILICVLTFVTTSFASQYGSISGYVLDENFEGLPGADVKILNTNCKSEADDNGYYKILGVKAGIYTIQLMFVGYAPFKVYNVKILPESDTEIVVCMSNDEMSGFYGEFDGSDAKITPYNPSQKKIDLEKTGLIEIKAQSKCPKLDFARQFKILQKEKEGKFPHIDIHQYEGKYRIGSDGIIEVIAKDSSLYIYNYEYFRPESRRHYKFKLYHEGKGEFIFTKTSGNIIFENNKIHLNYIDEFAMIAEGDIGIRISDISNIPLVLMQQGKIYEAIRLYKEIYRSDQKDKYISEKRLKHIFLSIESDPMENEMKISFVTMCHEFYPESSFFYFHLGDLKEKSNDIESALEYYIEAQKYGFIDKIGLENRIEKLKKNIKE